MKTYLEINEIERLEKTASNLRDRLLIRLLFHLGCRVSEALSIGVDDIDITNRSIRIQHLKTRLKLSCPQCGAGVGGGHVFCPKCGERVLEAVAKELAHRRQRVLPVDSKTLTMILEYIERGGPVARDGKLVIFGINRHRAWQIVKECGEKAGLPKLVNPETGRVHNVSPHRLRDAFATHAVKLDDSGDGLRMLQEHLGHQSFNTTARYRKISGKEHSDWYLKLFDREENDNSKA